MSVSTQADEIIRAVCAAYRNSDLRADNPDIREAINNALSEKDHQIEVLTIEKNRALDRVKQEERGNRMSSTSAMLHAEKLNDIAELVALKDGNHIQWLEPEEVTEHVQELADSHKRLRDILREIVAAEYVALEEVQY
jgi:Ni,Fe-hydrogenase I small subunit